MSTPVQHDEIVSAVSATRSFNAKELSLLASMKALTGTPSAKQKTWLDKLAREARGGGQ